LADQTALAGRIEADVGGKREPARHVGALKAAQARVHGGEAALGEAHHGDALGVDSRMPPEHRERAKRVDGHRDGAELRLVAPGLGDAATTEAVDDEDGYPEAEQLVGPAEGIGPDPAGAVQHDQGGGPVARPRAAQLAPEPGRTAARDPRWEPALRQG